MWSCLVPILVLFAQPEPSGGRMPQLDSLAADVIKLGSIPEGGRLIILAASNGWPGPVGGISLTDGSMDFPAEGFSASDMMWGFGGTDRSGVLVTAPAPRSVPGGLPFTARKGDSAIFTLAGESAEVVLVASPQGIISEIPPDAEGRYTLSLDETGVYWVEAMKAGAAGPEVLMLLPLLCDVGLADVLAGRVMIPGSTASSSGDLLSELNSLRADRDLPPLVRDGMLDSIAGRRAGRVALSGSILHPDGLLEEIGGERVFFAENIGRGSGLDEAWSMILTSPAHLLTCLGAGYDSVGMASAIEIERDGWQFILVQVFSGDDR